MQGTASDPAYFTGHTPSNPTGSSSEEGSNSRLVDWLYHSTLGREQLRREREKRERKGESGRVVSVVQWYLAHEKTHPPRTLPYAYPWGPRGVLGG